VLKNWQVNHDLKEYVEHPELHEPPYKGRQIQSMPMILKIACFPFEKVVKAVEEVGALIVEILQMKSLMNSLRRQGKKKGQDSVEAFPF
jgi:hypothetical protein